MFFPENKVFFCLGTQPSQFIKVLNSGILLPYQHVKHKINLTLRPGITFTFLKFLQIVDTNSWRHLLYQLVRFSHAFPLDSFSLLLELVPRSVLTTIIAGKY